VSEGSQHLGKDSFVGKPPLDDGAKVRWSSLWGTFLHLARVVAIEFRARRNHGRTNWSLRFVIFWWASQGRVFFSPTRAGPAPELPRNFPIRGRDTV